MPLWSRKETTNGAPHQASDRENILGTYIQLDKLQRQLRTEQYIQLSRAQRGQIMANIKRGISAKQMDVYFKRDLKVIDDSRDRCSANLEFHKAWMLPIFDALTLNEQREFAFYFLRASTDLYTVATGDCDTDGIDGAKARLIFYYHLFDLERLHQASTINDAMLQPGVAGLYDACRVHFLAYEGVPERIEQWLVDRSDREAAREYWGDDSESSQPSSRPGAKSKDRPAPTAYSTGE
jgi:hypothetical protein